MLEGRRINLRMAEREDAVPLAQWFSDVKFAGNYQNFPVQISGAELEKRIAEHKNYGNEWVDFMIEKKDGTGIGWAAYYVSAPNFGWIEIGYLIIPEERNKGYGTEAIHLLADYLFLSKNIMRIQAVTDTQNLASRQALVKAGFKKEGTLRKALWNSKGELADSHLYCLLREEWKKPRILMKSSKIKKDQRESHCM